MYLENLRIPKDTKQKGALNKILKNRYIIYLNRKWR
jgi:hypothetical protein